MEMVIEEVKSCKDPGVIMSSDGEFEAQINKACQKSRQKCGWILRTFYSRKQFFMRHEFNTLVQPHLDYCVQLWAPHEGPKLDQIEDTLRNYTKKIPAVKDQTYWERLRILRMNSEQRRIERYKILYTWKVLHGLVPDSGMEWLPTNENRGRMCKVLFSRDARRLDTFQLT